MNYIITIGYLTIPTTIGLAIYFWSSTFKQLGSMSQEELNEDDEYEEDSVSENEAKFVNTFGDFVFVTIGVIIWTLLGITIGRTIAHLAPSGFLKWVIYFFGYFIFLRFPFGVGNKMVKRSYSFESFPEKIFFSLAMIASFIVSICCYEILPNFLKWHMQFLN